MEFDEIKNQLKICFSCGTCTGSCPIARVEPEKNPRRFINSILTSKDISVLEEYEPLWLCTSCYACEDRCPQGINITTLLIKLKNISAKEKYIPPSIEAEVETITKNGVTTPPIQSILMRRNKLNLPELPKPNLEIIQRIIKLTSEE